MRKQTAAAMAVAATMAATGLVWTAPASAQPATQCTGEGGDVTVPGDLVVPAGQSCVLDGATVEGNVLVARNADLVATDSTFNGRVDVRKNGYLEAVGSSVAGQVETTGAFGGYVDGTDVGGDIATRADGRTPGGFLHAVDAALGGKVISRSGEILIESSNVAGAVNSRNSTYTDVYSSFLDGNLVVRNNAAGSIVCGVAVQGHGRFLDNADLVQIGSDGPLPSCSTASYWGGDLTASHTDGAVYVDNNIVRGDLTLHDNYPVAALGPANSVRGDIIGEYRNWDPSAHLQQRSAAPHSAAQRSDALEVKINKRHDAAVANAERAGVANIGR